MPRTRNDGVTDYWWAMLLTDKWTGILQGVSCYVQAMFRTDFLDSKIKKKMCQFYF